MKIPHDPVALEEHFKDDDEGPVSNQGYMPYLNTFILDKVSSFLRQLLRKRSLSVGNRVFNTVRGMKIHQMPLVLMEVGYFHLYLDMYQLMQYW